MKSTAFHQPSREITLKILQFALCTGPTGF